MLISDEYKKQNELLHLENLRYGTSGKEFSVIIQELIDKLDIHEVLDYGAGKCTLQDELGWSKNYYNYDPAVPEIAQLPNPSQFVVCTEVLEHIEPNCLDDVLSHIQSLTKEYVFFSVATIEARKYLPDGRNAHLIVESPDWWCSKLESYFRLLKMFTISNGIIFIGENYRKVGETPDISESIGPPPTTKKINLKSVWTDEQRCSNIRQAMLRNLPTIKQLEPHGNVMKLACYGPSLKQYTHRLLREEGDLYSVSGAHSYLIENHIIPIAHIEADPRPHKVKCIGEAHPGVVYFLASACNPEVFKLVYGHETWIYHVISSVAESNLISSMDWTHPLTISGGTNVGMTAIYLGYTLGYRNFSIYGMDCSFECDGEMLNWPNDKDFPTDFRNNIKFHAGFHPNENQPVYRVWVGNRPFLSSPQMIQGVQDFAVIRNRLSDCKFDLHGDGFLRHFIQYYVEGIKTSV